jgi:hypothetical protein
LDSYPRCKEQIRHQKQENYDPEAVRQSNAAYRAKHRERLNEENRKWREANKERHRQRSREWYANHREHARSRMDKYSKARRKVDPAYRLTCNLRGRMYRVLHGKHKAGSAIRDLGCTPEQLKQHLEEQFTPEMSWENYGVVWEVDHILPLANYQLEDRGTYRRLAHHTNLQPLLLADNRRKKNLE